MDVLQHAKTAISQGSRILAHLGVVDGFGHLSCRSPVHPDRLLMSRSLSPALVTPEDVIELDLDGEVVSPAQGARPFMERFIHAEIYRRRPDVQAVVHSHALPVVPFTVVPGARIRPIWHICGFLEGAPSAFDIADHAGPSSDILVRSSELGRHLAEHLGEANVVPMRSHGFTAVGGNVPQAVFHAVYTMRNCEIELAARALGQPRFLSSGEAEACERNISTQIPLAWALWLRQCPPVEAAVQA